MFPRAQTAPEKTTGDTCTVPLPPHTTGTSSRSSSGTRASGASEGGLGALVRGYRTQRSLWGYHGSCPPRPHWGGLAPLSAHTATPSCERPHVVRLPGAGQRGEQSALDSHPHYSPGPRLRHEQGSFERMGRVGDPKICILKMARQQFPYHKFRFFPRWSLWSGEGGGGGLPPLVFNHCKDALAMSMQRAALGNEQTCTSKKSANLGLAIGQAHDLHISLVCGVACSHATPFANAM